MFYTIYKIFWLFFTIFRIIVSSKFAISAIISSPERYSSIVLCTKTEIINLFPFGSYTIPISFIAHVSPASFVNELAVLCANLYELAT